MGKKLDFTGIRQLLYVCKWLPGFWKLQSSNYQWGDLLGGRGWLKGADIVLPPLGGYG